MSINQYLLVGAALLPAVILGVYVYKKDRCEKEPLWLLGLLFVLGAVSCYPAAEVESAAFGIIDDIFSPYAVSEADGVLYLSGATYKLYNAVKYFLGVALVEEAFKWIILVGVTKKNKNFNSLFDGVIYAVFVSLGFAALENIFYVTEYGWMNAVMRGILSVPGHMFDGVLMGYYYSMWHMHGKAKGYERSLKNAGLISPFAKEFSITRFAILSLAVPVAAHGLYDYCCTLGGNLATIVFYGFVLFLYIYCFGKIKKMSGYDMSDERFSNVLVYSKYPGLVERIRQVNEVTSEAEQMQEQINV